MSDPGLSSGEDVSSGSQGRSESTVLENVVLALHLHAATAFVPTLIATAAYRERAASSLSM